MDSSNKILVDNAGLTKSSVSGKWIFWRGQAEVELITSFNFVKSIHGLHQTNKIEPILTPLISSIYLLNCNSGK